MFEILYVLIHIIFISPINVMFGWKKRSNRSANIDRTKYKTYYHINIFYFVNLIVLQDILPFYTKHCLSEISKKKQNE